MKSQSVLDALIEFGILQPDRLIEERLTVRDVSRRNVNFIVARRDGAGFVVKQARSHEHAVTLAREASCATAARGVARSFSVPKVVAWDARRSRLVLELVRDARTLRATIGNRRSISRAHARSLGRALGELHEAPLSSFGNEPLGTAPPLVAALARPTAAHYAQFSIATQQLVAILQGSDVIHAELVRLSATWKTENLIHGDIRWDNVLVARAAKTGGARLWLIDWEMAAGGDPLWDVAGFIADGVWHWLSSIPADDAGEPRVDDALRPLAMLVPAFEACWEGYRAARRLADDPERVLALLRMCALRLVQVAYERMQGERRLGRHVVMAVQFVENVLRDTVAVRGLFGDLR